MRLIHAVRELNREAGPDGAQLRTIALFTTPDRGAMFVREADEAVDLGAATFVDERDGERKSSYLDYARLEQALVAARADAAWVGWGFVAEHAAFAELCQRLGIVFIGPESNVMRRLGDKIAAKHLAERASVPVVPWSSGPVETLDDARQHAERLGYPLMFKATAGGGGRGIRTVHSAMELGEAFESARAEALRTCGDATVFLERQVTGARHVEVQVVADHYGTTWAVGVRDCSIQRRNQKVLEEAPSPVLTVEQDQALRDAAVRLCQSAGYRNAGTVEFLFDPAEPRLLLHGGQHAPAGGAPGDRNDDGSRPGQATAACGAGWPAVGVPPVPRGHAIEVRLNAEDADNDFTPASGVSRCSDSRPALGCVSIPASTAAISIPPEFDSMIAKLIAYGHDRREALARLQRGLADCLVVIDGGSTNKAFLLSLASHPDIVASRYDNRWLDRLTEAGGHLPPVDPVALLAAAVEAADADQAAVQANFLAAAARGRPELPDQVGHRLRLRARGGVYQMSVYCLGGGAYRVAVGPDGDGADGDGADGDGPGPSADTRPGTIVVDLTVTRLGRYERAITGNGRRYKIVAASQGARLLIEVDSVPHAITRDDGGHVRSPSPAFVVAVLVAEGDIVRTGDPLAVIESMKMETTITAPHDGVVTAVLAPLNTQVKAGTPLFALRESGQRACGSESGGQAADFGGLAAPRGTSDEAGLDHMIKAFLLGYDIQDGDARELSRERGKRLAGATPHDAALRRDQELLEIFADAAALSRHVPADGEEDDTREARRSTCSPTCRSSILSAAGYPGISRGGCGRHWPATASSR